MNCNEFKRTLLKLSSNDKDKILHFNLNDYFLILIIVYLFSDLNLIDWGSMNILAVALYGTLYLWNASTGDIQQLLDMPNQDDYISSVSWLPEGNILAIGTSSAEVQLWDVSREKKIRTMKSHSARVPSLSWNSFILSRYVAF